MKKFSCFLFLLLSFPIIAQAFWLWNNQEIAAPLKGNRHSQSFYAVKKEMLAKIYYDHRQTLYCGATFDRFKRIIPLKGFVLPDLQEVDFRVYDIDETELKRKAERMEWEHIVPAQNFGKTFSEWSQGHPQCIGHKGKRFKGRSCAEQQSEDFRYIYTDMYNLYPAIGAVNYLRGNFNMTQFSPTERVENLFGHCSFKISRNKVEPREEVRGLIARTYFYMEKTYPRYKIGEPMRGILNTWHKKYPVTPWECVRAYRIEKVQGNANEMVKKACLHKNFYKEKE